MLAFGLWWLRRAEAVARRTSEGFGVDETSVEDKAADDEFVRERAVTAREFDPAEIHRGRHTDAAPPIICAILPLVVVIVVNLLMPLVILPRLDLSFLAEERWAPRRLRRLAVFGRYGGPRSCRRYGRDRQPVPAAGVT